MSMSLSGRFSPRALEPKERDAEHFWAPAQFVHERDELRFHLATLRLGQHANSALGRPRISVPGADSCSSSGSLTAFAATGWEADEDNAGQATRHAPGGHLRTLAQTAVASSGPRGADQPSRTMPP